MVRTLKAMAKFSHKIDNSARRAKICMPSCVRKTADYIGSEYINYTKVNQKTSFFMPHHPVTV